jgi:hypothetical protein
MLRKLASMSIEFCRSPRLWCLGVAAFAMTGTQATAQPTPPRSLEFPPGALKQFEQLPTGRFRTQIDGLSQAAQRRALNWMQGFHFTDLDLVSLHADNDGGIFYADLFPIEPAPAEADTPVVSEAAVPVSPFPTSLIFHSKPGAPNVLFLNFSGEDVSGTAWNSSVGRTTIPAVAFSSDSDFSTFSDSEQLVIKRVWLRVAEDYAPFNIDVTTERPASFTSRTAHALITRNTDANGDTNPSSSAGGVAYVNVFGGSSYANYRPAWIYFNNLGSSESNIAEATSHEIGHNLGLSHDAKTDGISYYGGHGSGDISWGPVMGTGYSRNVSQWCKGEYYLANNTEDDLAIIAGKISYRTDDHGNTRAAATALVLTGGTNVVSTTPETDPTNTNSANKGVLERNTDMDVFSFVTGSGQMSLTVNPWIMPSGTRGGNLDVLLELYDEAGALILTNNVSTRTYASIETSLPEGLYFLQVRNTGVGDPLSSTPTGYTSYASIGQYFISGYLRPSGYVAPPQAELQVTDITQPGTGAKQFTVTYTDNLAVDVSTIDGSDVRITGPDGYDRTAQLVSIDNSSDGTPRTATYATEPPSSSVWTHNDNGVYTLTIRTNQVSDTEGGWVAGQQLGQFIVNVPLVVYSDNLDVNSGWTLQPQWQYGTPSYSGNGPTNGFTGTNIIAYDLSGNYANNLSMVYATSPVIDCSGADSLTLRFQRWLRLRNNDTAVIEISTNGTSWMTVWSTTSSVQDSSWQAVQYALPGSVAGSSTVRLRLGQASNGSQTDIGWNVDDIEILGQPGGPTPQFVLTATANNPAWGTVSPSTGSYPSGASANVTAAPATYFQFKNWAGDATGTNNPVTVTLNTNLFVQAVFEEMLTTNHPTPLWWLASYGYTQNLESAVTTLGSNRVALWQSYIAGLNPNDANSQLRLFVTTGGGNSVVLQWNAVTGRVYTIWSSTNGMNTFAPITSAADLPSTITAITNSPISSSPMTLYRLEVRKP